MLFVHYEAMAADFGAVRDAVAAFLGCALTPDEKRRIDEKCSFRYMTAHEPSFEMVSPTMFSVSGAKFMKGGVSGSGPREGNIPAVVQRRIIAYLPRSALWERVSGRALLSRFGGQGDRTTGGSGCCGGRCMSESLAPADASPPKFRRLQRRSRRREFDALTEAPTTRG